MKTPAESAGPSVPFQCCFSSLRTLPHSRIAGKLSIFYTNVYKLHFIRPQTIISPPLMERVGRESDERESERESEGGRLRRLCCRTV